MNFSRRRLLVEQIVVVAVLGSEQLHNLTVHRLLTVHGIKVDAMRHVPHFINNGYLNKLFDSILQTYLNKKCRVSSKNIAPPNTHNIYYQNQFSNSYKTDERIIKQIVKDNIKCVNESDLLKMIIYCKSHTITNLISENNLSHKSNPLKQTDTYISTHVMLETVSSKILLI